MTTSTKNDTLNATAATASTEVDQILKSGLAKLSSGTVKMGDLLATLSPTAHVARAEAPKVLPTPAAITEKEHKALERLPEVYGQVVPTERRALTSVEVTALVEEKVTLAEIKTMVTKREANIRTTIYNHFDVTLENGPFSTDSLGRDKDGHYIEDGVADVEPGTSQTFKRETRSSAPGISIERLQEMVDDPEFPDFTHADYLAMTTQTRAVDEHKFMLHLQKKPTLLGAVARATSPGSKTTALNLRKTT